MTPVIVSEQILEVVGRIHDVKERHKRDNGYFVREFVLEMPKANPSSTPQYRKLTAVNKAISDLDVLGKGKLVRARFRARGRYYTKSRGDGSTAQDVANYDEAISVEAYEAISDHEKN